MLGAPGHTTASGQASPGKPLPRQCLKCRRKLRAVRCHAEAPGTRAGRLQGWLGVAGRQRGSSSCKNRSVCLGLVGQHCSWHDAGGWVILPQAETHVRCSRMYVTRCPSWMPCWRRTPENPCTVECCAGRCPPPGLTRLLCHSPSARALCSCAAVQLPFMEGTVVKRPGGRTVTCKCRLCCTPVSFGFG